MKSLKRFVAVFLAAIMLFSSFSLLASAEIDDGNQSTIEFDTKFYRNTGTASAPVWTETTKAAPGEDIKARVFFKTDFGIGASELFWLWSKNSVTMSSKYTANKLMVAVTNPDENSEAYINELGGKFKIDSEYSSVGADLVDFGYLPEDTFDNYGYIYAILSQGKSTKFSGDYWFYEFDFTVNKDNPETTDVNEGPTEPFQLYFPVSVLATSDEATWDSQIYLGKHEDADLGIGLGSNNLESYEEWDVDPIVVNNDKDEDSTLVFTSTATYNSGEGTFADGSTVKSITATIGSEYSIEDPIAPAGKKFVGWSSMSRAAGASSGTMGFDDQSFIATYETTADPSYTINVYSMGIDESYGEAVPTEGTKPAGETLTYDETTIPDGFALDTEKTTATSLTMSKDSDNTLNIYLKRNSYDVIFNNEDGTEAAKLPGLYEATVKAPAADEKAGYTFAGWSDGENLYAAGADVKVPLNGATLTATYTPNTDTAYTVNIYTMDIDGVYGEAEVVPGTVGTTGETVTYTAAPGEGLYLDTQKSTPELKTTITVDDSDVINVYYARNAYEVKVDGVAQEKKVYHGATFTAPSTSTTTKTGYKLTGWTVGDKSYGIGAAIPVTSAIELVAVNTANDYTLTYTVDGDWPVNYEEPEAEAVKFDGTFTLADLAVVAPVTGYKFSGWTVESGATYDEATGVYTVTGDVEVVGEWTHVEYTLSYYLTEEDYADGVAYATAPYYYDDTIEPFEPDQADILGKKFVEWETADGEAMPKTMPAGNLAVIATFNDYEVIFYDEYGDVAEIFYGLDSVTEADAPDMTSDEFDFGGWLVNGETDKEKAVTTFSYEVTENYEFVPVCTVNVVYYKDYNDAGEPVDEYKTLVYDFNYAPTADDAQLAALGVPTKEGHEFTGWDFDIVDNELTSHSYAVATWEAKTYTATFNAVNGELKGAFADSETTKTVEDVTYGKEITFADVPVLSGYTFQGWTDVEGGTVKVDPLMMNKEGKTFYAIYTANGQAGYTVEIYLMGTDGTYAAEATDKDTTKTGTIGVAATAAHADYAQDAWFSADTANENNVLSKVVAEDGSTVLKLYYARASYEVKVDGVAQTDKVYHGATFTAPAASTTTEAGYTLTGWKVGETTYAIGDEIPVTGATELVAVNTPNADTAYTVNIYTMDINGAYGEAEAVPGTVGTTGETVTYTAAPGEGLYLDAENSTAGLSTTITADDTDVINVYYARYAYEVKVDGVAQEKKVYHGATFTAPAASTTVPSGYHLTGWTDGATDYAIGEAITVTAALALEAKYEANTDTAYTVNIYTMDIDGVYGEAEVVPGTVGTTGETVTYTAAPGEGLYLDAENSTAGLSTTITADDTDVINVYYARNAYEVKVDGVAQTDKVYHGATFTAPSASTAVPSGYHLTGWTDGTTDYAIGEAITVTAALALEAKYEANTDTAYKVEIYLMDANGNYALADTDDKTGKTEAPVSAAHADYIAGLDSFYLADTENVNNVTSDNIAGDGSTTLKLYFKRASYTYSFTAGEETVASGTALHGATIKAPAYTPDAGYTFGGWTDGENTYAANTNITVESDLAYTAIITANAGIPYKVETHVMNTDGETYEVTTETAYGKTGDPVSIHPASMEGFTPNAKESVLEGTIAADGSTTLKVVYDRNKYTIKVNGVEDEYLYGEEIEVEDVPADEIPEGHKQDGWVDENSKPVTVPYPVDENNPTEINPNIVPIEYLVEFTVDGKPFVSANAAFGTAIQNPGTPGEEWIPEGYTFGGWSVDGKTEVTDFGTVDVDGNTFVAILNAISYNLTFKDAEGNVLSGPTSTEFGSTLAALAPTAPDKSDSGLIFAGWAEEADETVKMPATMPAKDVVYKATYVQNTTPVKYAIEIYMMDTNGDYTLSARTISYGYIGTTQTIEAGNMEGCTVDTAMSHLSDVIASDGSTVLKIYYARNLYTVTFGDNKPVEVYYGAAIPVPADPESTEEGKVFAGWAPEVPATMPADNLVFEATWEAGVYTITYVINGVTEEPIPYTYGEKVATPATPNVGGLKFIGWTPEVPKTMPAENLIIVAQFEADIFKVTFLDDVDGEVFDVKYVAYGDEITLPTGEPSKMYHTFEGWLAVPETMPAEDIVIVPNFVSVPVALVEQPGSTTVIDRANKVIYGLGTRMKASDYDKIYLDVEGDGYFTVTPADGRAGFYGTGTVISLYDNNSTTGEPVEVYYVVVFGDVNGDSDINAADASAVEDEYFWVTGWSREGSDDYAYYKLIAGDLDKDGDIDVNDHTNIVNYTVGVIAIDQTTGTVER